MYLSPLVVVACLILWGPGLFHSIGLYSAQYAGGTYAFYMDTGQTFFGEIRSVTPSTITLANVYTFQTYTVGETPTTNLTAQQLNPLTMPYNWMALNWKHVTYYERVGSRGKVINIMRNAQQ